MSIRFAAMTASAAVLLMLSMPAYAATPAIAVSAAKVADTPQLIHKAQTTRRSENRRRALRADRYHDRRRSGRRPYGGARIPDIGGPVVYTYPWFANSYGGRR